MEKIEFCKIFFFLKDSCWRWGTFRLYFYSGIMIISLFINFFTFSVYSGQDEAVTLNNNALEYMRKGMVDEATPLLEKAYNLNSENQIIRENLIGAYYLKAKEYEKKGDYDLCIEEYQKILNRFSNDNLTLKNFITSLNNIGVTYSEKKNYTESEKYFRLAINLLREYKDKDLSKVVSVNYAGVLNNLAYKDYLNQEKLSAISDLKRSLRLDPSNPDTYQLLGDIYYDSNNYDYAQLYFEKSLKINPTNSNLKKKLNMLLREIKIEKDFFQMEDEEKKFVIHYQYDKDKEQVAKILEVLTLAYKKLGNDLDFYPRQQISVKIYTSQQFGYITEMPEWAIGLYDGKIRLKYDDFKSELYYLKQTIYHEYTHSVLSLLIKKNLPVWVQEGFAQYEEPNKEITVDEMKLVVEEYKKKGIKGLGFKDETEVEFYNKNSLSQLYVCSKLFVDYLVKTYEMNKLRDFLIGNVYEKDWKSAFKKAYGKEFDVVVEEWIKYLKWNLIGKN